MIVFDTILEIFIMVSYLSSTCSSTSGSSGILQPDQKHRTQKAAEKANELFCYKCQTLEVTQNYCMNISQPSPELKSKCDEDKRICMVKKVSFMSTGENATIGYKTWSLERSCTHRCEPGCIVIGERLKLRKCVSCCDDHLCNFGNSAPLINVPMAAPLLLLSLIPFKTH